MERRSFLKGSLAWGSWLLGIGALHARLNRGGLANVFRPTPRDRLTVGHLPVT